MSAPTPQLNPFTLITVNWVPKRAKKIVGQVIEDVKDTFAIKHIANVDKIAEASTTVDELKPDSLIIALMWSPVQAQEIQIAAKEACPSIKIVGGPVVLQVKGGSAAVVGYLKEVLPALLRVGK